MINYILITPENEISLIKASSDIELENKIMDYVTPYYKKKMNIWEELNNIYNEEQLLEMALPLAVAKERLNNNAKQYFYHLFKCIIFEDSTGDLYHWEQEIANYLNIINNIKIKSNNGKPSVKFYEDNFFYYFGDEAKDYEGGLEDFKNRIGKRYPSFEVTEELYNKVFEVVQDFALYFANIFARENNLNSIKISNKIEDYFKDGELK